MNILVTGAAGYLGSVLVPRLLNEDWKVIALDNFMYRQTSLLECCHHDKLNVVRGDARDKRLVSELLKKADAVIPLACLTGAPLCAKEPAAARHINLDAVDMLMKGCSRDQMVIFPTTNSGYGIGEPGIYCTEESSLKPVSLYGRLKVAAEEIVLDTGCGISLRLATVFGISPRMRLDLLVNDFTYRAVNDRFVVLFEAHFKRNYIHVRDVAGAFVHCIRHFGKMKGEPYNVGLSDSNLSKLELCREIKKQVPGFYFVEAEVGEDPDKRNYVVSNEKIEKTGFMPAYSLQKGITELIKGYRIIKENQFSNI